MELNQLRYFCKACETGSISAAAAQLGVVEQTVSAAVIRLERELGNVLLERGKSGVAPTAAGRLLYQRALEVVRLVDAIPAEVARAGEPDRRVRFAFTTDSLTSGPGLLSTDDLTPFMQGHPGVTVELAEHSSPGCLQLLHNGEADLALVAGKPDEGEFEASFVLDGALCMAFPATHRLAGKDAVSFADLRDETILTTPDTDYTLDVIKERCRAHGFEPRLKTVSMRYYFEAAQRGEGFASIPAGHPALVEYPGLLARPIAEGDDFQIPLYLAVRKNAPLSPETRALRAWLLERWG